VHARREKTSDDTLRRRRFFSDNDALFSRIQDYAAPRTIPRLAAASALALALVLEEHGLIAAVLSDFPDVSGSTDSES
jgi:hypothetical protein